MKGRPSSRRSDAPNKRDGEAGEDGLEVTANGRVAGKEDKNRLNASLTQRTKVNGEHPVRESSRGSLDRKLSSPMAPAFMVSAPGKVIVYGEHAVVHGKVTFHSKHLPKRREHC